MVKFPLGQMFDGYIPMIFLEGSSVDQPIKIFLFRVHDNDTVHRNTLLLQFLNQGQKLVIRLVDRNNNVHLLHTLLLHCLPCCGSFSAPKGAASV
jgi:hypothetical protein